MQMFRKKDGFTLIELLIVILTGTIVTTAATTVLLLAMRINRKSLDTVERQSIMRIMQSVFENLGSDGNYEFTTDAIKVKGSETDYVLSYDAANDQLVTGQGGILMEDVTSFHLTETTTPFDYVRGLYTFSIESQGEQYLSSVYGRTQDENWFADDPALDYEAGRNLLVDIAASQIGSAGEIQAYKNLIPQDRHYNLWYLNRTLAEGYEAGSGWSDDTAWCSVFTSWVLEKTYERYGTKLDNNSNSVRYLNFVPKQAVVNYLWLETYAQSGSESLHIYGDGYIPQPGDLIFFTDVKEQAEEQGLIPLKNLDDVLVVLENEDPVSIIRTEIWRESQELYIHEGHAVGVPTEAGCFSVTESEIFEEKYNILKHLLGVSGDGLDHVGIVAKVETEILNGEEVSYVYTIEGNVDSKVIMRKFPLVNTVYSDAIQNTTGPNKLLHIFGYATLNWNPAYK